LRRRIHKLGIEKLELEIDRLRDMVKIKNDTCRRLRGLLEEHGIKEQVVFQVKISQFKVRSAWYSKFVGQVFDVIEEDEYLYLVLYEGDLKPINKKNADKVVN
jgi:N-glycosylase/DNA lyase